MQANSSNIEPIGPSNDKKRARHHHPHVITITSGKGGVGKTNIAANLAWQLRQNRRRVLLLDADLGLANIDIIFGLSPQYNMSHVLAGEKTLSEILVKGPAGVMVLPASSGVQLESITEEQKIVLLQQMEDLEQNFDFMLIDTGAGISSDVIYFALAAQTTVLVLTPEPTSLADSYAVIKVLSTTYRQHAFKIIVNEVSGEYEGLEVFNRLTTVADRFLNVSIDYLGYVPRDLKLREAVRAQKPFAEMFPNGPATQGIKRIARQLVALENDPLQSDLGLLWRNILLGTEAA